MRKGCLTTRIVSVILVIQMMFFSTWIGAANAASDFVVIHTEDFETGTSVTFGRFGKSESKISEIGVFNMDNAVDGSSVARVVNVDKTTGMRVFGVLPALTNDYVGKKVKITAFVNIPASSENGNSTNFRMFLQSNNPKDAAVISDSDDLRVAHASTKLAVNQWNEVSITYTVTQPMIDGEYTTLSFDSNNGDPWCSEILVDAVSFAVEGGETTTGSNSVSDIGTKPKAVQLLEIPKDKPYWHAASVLSALGVMIGKTETDFDAEASLTRAELVTIILRLIGNDASGKAFSDPPFNDMTKEHWASQNVVVSTGLGITNGENGRFRPDDSVTLEETVKMLVCALGYEPMALENGGYPAGYMMVGKKLGLLTGINISAASNVTRGEAAMMAYQALEADMMTATYGTGISYEIREGLTLLEDVHETRIVDGVVMQVGRDNADSAESKGITYVRIDVDSDATDDENGTLFKTTLVPDDLLGLPVKLYCTGENKNDEYVIACFEKDENVNRADIKSDDITKIKHADSNAFSIEYYADNKTKTFDVSKPVYIYNKSIIKESDFASKEDFEAFVSDERIQGRIRVLNTKRAQTGGFVIIEDYSAFVFEGMNSDADVIYYTGYTYNIESKTFRTGTKEYNLSAIDGSEADIYVYNEKDARVELSAISKNDVIMIYPSVDRKRYDIYISKKTLQGKVETIKSTGGSVNHSQSYMVSFYSDNELVDGFEVQSGETAQEPGTPTQPDGGPWIFGGWYSDTEFTQQFDFSEPIMTDTILYAKWQKSANNSGYVTLAREDFEDGSAALSRLDVKFVENIEIKNDLTESNVKVTTQDSNKVLEVVSQSKSSGVLIHGLLPELGLYDQEIINLPIKISAKIQSSAKLGSDSGNPTVAMYIPATATGRAFCKKLVETSLSNTAIAQTAQTLGAWKNVSFEYTPSEAMDASQRPLSELNSREILRIDNGQNSNGPNRYSEKIWIDDIEVSVKIGVGGSYVKPTEAQNGGTGTLVLTDDSRFSAKIDGVSYNTTDMQKIAPFRSPILTVGFSAKFYLDREDRIVGCKTSESSEENVGMLMKIALSDTAFGRPVVRILTPGGDIKDFECEEQIEAFDGASVRKISVADLITDMPLDPMTDWHLWSKNNASEFEAVNRTWLSDTNRSNAANRRLVYYSLNSEGRIKRILVPSIPEDVSGGKLEMVYNFGFGFKNGGGGGLGNTGTVDTSKQLYYNKRTKMLVRNDVSGLAVGDETAYRLADDATVFEVLANEYGTEDYTVRTDGIGALPDNVFCYVQLYKWRGSDKVNFVVYNQARPIAASMHTLVFDAIEIQGDKKYISGYSVGGDLVRYELRENLRLMENIWSFDAAGQDLVTYDKLTANYNNCVGNAAPYNVTRELLGQSTPYVGDTDDANALKHGDIVRVGLDNSDKAAYVEVLMRQDIKISSARSPYDASTARTLLRSDGSIIRGKVEDLDAFGGYISCSAYYWAGRIDFISSYARESATSSVYNPSGPAETMYTQLSTGRICHSTFPIAVDLAKNILVHNCERGTTLKGSVADIALHDELLIVGSAFNPIVVIVLKKL